MPIEIQSTTVSLLVSARPVQAGVMTVMAIAQTARFTVSRLNRRVF
jgi:uncharacterized protein with ACT and thioredoxin-like domain